MVCSANFRRKALNLLKDNSIGLRSGEYAGKYSTFAPRAPIDSSTPATLCTRQLSIATMSRRFSRPQNLLDISQECWPVHGALYNHRRRHPIMTQAGNECDGFPFSLRNLTDQPLAARAAAPDTDHIRGDRRLVDKHQPRRIKVPLLPNPTSPRSRYVFSMSLGCT